jgi:carbamate kinase
MLLVVGLGDGPLAPPASGDGAGVEPALVETAARAVAELAIANDVVVTHGNVPQLDLLETRNQVIGRRRARTVDVLGAETEGIIGYLLDQELASRLPERRVATLLTQVVVDADDPAFTTPAQRLGLQFTETEARALAIGRRWAMARGHHDRFRRVVPSPDPRHIVELDTIRLLVDAGTIVICAGGGGVPVLQEPDGGLRGVEAAVDKDLATARLAVELEADMLVLLTDVAAVYTGWGTTHPRPIESAAPAELRALRLPAGSMGPKVEAACRFAEATGAVAAIGAVHEAARLVKGESGTRVHT